MLQLTTTVILVSHQSVYRKYHYQDVYVIAPAGLSICKEELIKFRRFSDSRVTLIFQAQQPSLLWNLVYYNTYTHTHIHIFIYIIIYIILYYYIVYIILLLCYMRLGVREPGLLEQGIHGAGQKT